MKKINIIFYLIFLLMVSCQQGKKYKYIEIISKRDVFDNWKREESDAEYIRAESDSAAYLQAFQKWQITLSANKKTEELMREKVGSHHESHSRPYAFKLYNENGIDISNRVTFLDKTKLENQIIERFNRITSRSKEPKKRFNWVERFVHEPANIRKGKSANTDIVGHLKRNASVYAIRDSLKPYWTAVYSNRNIDSKIGYVYTSLLNSNSLPILQVTEVNLRSRRYGHGYEVSGSVRNNGNSRYRFVTVRISWMNSNGDVVDTSSTYAVGSEGIFPGESSTYSYFTRRTDINRVSVSILDYQ